MCSSDLTGADLLGMVSNQSVKQVGLMGYGYGYGGSYGYGGYGGYGHYAYGRYLPTRAEEGGAETVAAAGSGRRPFKLPKASKAARRQLRRLVNWIDGRR